MDRRTTGESVVMELSEQEAQEAFDAVARRAMGISDPEFLRRWAAGYYAAQPMDDVEGLVET